MAIKELVTATCNLITGLQTPNSPKSQSSNQSTRAAQSDVSMTPPGGGVGVYLVHNSIQSNKHETSLKKL